MPPEPLRLLLDENVPTSIAPWLQSLRPSLEVTHTLDIGLGGRSDREIYEWTQANSAIVVTFDEDFADLRAFPLEHHGVIRFRVWPTTVEESRDALGETLRTSLGRRLEGSSHHRRPK